MNCPKRQDRPWRFDFPNIICTFRICLLPSTLTSVELAVEFTGSLNSVLFFLFSHIFIYIFVLTSLTKRKFNIWWIMKILSKPWLDALVRVSKKHLILRKIKDLLRTIGGPYFFFFFPQRGTLVSFISWS